MTKQCRGKTFFYKHVNNIVEHEIENTEVLNDLVKKFKAIIAGGASHALMRGHTIQEYQTRHKSADVDLYFRSKEDFFSETKGIISLSYFKSGQDEVSGIAVWESKETLEANAERVQSIMGGLMDFVTTPPEIVEGNLEYQFKGK